MSNGQNMHLEEITLDDLLDSAILSHGFTPYKRDYFFHIETVWREPLAGQYLVLFRHCYDFSYTITAQPEIVVEAWDDLFTDWEKYKQASEPRGYVWGTNHIGAYPGFKKMDHSVKADEWTRKLHRPMNELEVLGEIFKMNLVYFDWTIKKLNENTSLINQIIFPMQ
jgi:hypothetical protein